MHTLTDLVILYGNSTCFKRMTQFSADCTYPVRLSITNWFVPKVAPPSCPGCAILLQLGPRYKIDSTNSVVSTAGNEHLPRSSEFFLSVLKCFGEDAHDQ